MNQLIYNIKTKRKQILFGFIPFLAITILAFCFSKEPIQHVFRLFLPWGKYLLLYLTCMVGFIIVLGNHSITLAIANFPILLVKIILPEIVIIISVAYFFICIVVILMVIYNCLSKVYMYLALLAVFLFIKLLGGIIVKFICVRCFLISKKEIIPDKDFSCITNASFYLLCAISIVCNDVHILSTTAAEYGILDLFLRGILAYLALDNALPILNSGLLVIFNKNKIKMRFSDFTRNWVYVKRLFNTKCKIIKRMINK